MGVLILTPYHGKRLLSPGGRGSVGGVLIPTPKDGGVFSSTSAL